MSLLPCGAWTPMEHRFYSACNLSLHDFTSLFLLCDDSPAKYGWVDDYDGRVERAQPRRIDGYHEKITTGIASVRASGISYLLRSNSTLSC